MCYIFLFLSTELLYVCAYVFISLPLYLNPVNYSRKDNLWTFRTGMVSSEWFISISQPLACDFVFLSSVPVCLPNIHVLSNMPVCLPNIKIPLRFASMPAQHSHSFRSASMPAQYQNSFQICQYACPILKFLSDLPVCLPNIHILSDLPVCLPNIKIPFRSASMPAHY